MLNVESRNCNCYPKHSLEVQVLNSIESGWFEPNLAEEIFV